VNVGVHDVTGTLLGACRAVSAVLAATTATTAAATTLTFIPKLL